MPNIHINMPTFFVQAGIANILKYIVQAGIANILKYIAYLIKLARRSAIIDIEQLVINHNTYNIAEQYVGHVRMRTCPSRPTK